MTAQTAVPSVAASPARRPDSFRRVSVLDSHTAGEPTRLILSGAPALRGETIAARMADLKENHASFRPSVLLEPRGSDVLVGALLCAPAKPASSAAVIFFNDVGFLGMCGHGTIGLIASLAFLGRIKAGEHTVETPVGDVRAILHRDGSVSVSNVPSYCYLLDVNVEVSGLGRITGDIAWGGNWFFLIHTPPPLPLRLEHVAELSRLSAAVREALEAAGIAGADGERIDHIEWFSAPEDPANDSRNFVLCPGAAYDRSPCGTGTSARLACMAARGELEAGQVWRQEGVLGTVFRAQYAPGPKPGRILPEITGHAWITGESTLLFDPEDPFAGGIRR